MSEQHRSRPEAKPDDASRDPKPGERKNVSPDAVKDPNEKTEGHPGLPAGPNDGNEADPGAG